MANEIDVSKVIEFVSLGPPTDNISTSKVTMYVLLAPGSDGSVALTQAHVYSQKIRRD
jgi:hypothetical protein